MRRRIGSIVVLVVIVCGLCLAAFLRREETAVRGQVVVDGFAQGGSYHVVLITDQKRDFKPAIDSLLEVVDGSMSLYTPTSLLSRINRGQTDTLDALLLDCITQAQQISRQSGGMYDITVKPLSSAYGFGAEDKTQEPNVDSLLQFVGYQKISIEGNLLRREHPNLQIDLNSIAQGATADFLGVYFESQGITEYLIEVGGEIYGRGHNAKNNPWRVGIDRPTEGNMVAGADLQVVIGLQDRGLATSGNYRKYYTNQQGEKIVHTVNPLTGRPVMSNLLSATIVAPTSTQADAYSTLCMVLGLEESRRFLATHPELDAYLVYSDSAGAFASYLTPGMEKLIIR